MATAQDEPGLMKMIKANLPRQRQRPLQQLMNKAGDQMTWGFLRCDGCYLNAL